MGWTRRKHVTYRSFKSEWLTEEERETSKCSLANEIPGEARLDHRRATGSISRKRMTNGNSESFSSQPTPTSQSTTSTEHRLCKGKGSGHLPSTPSPLPHTAFSPLSQFTHYSVQPSSVLRVLLQITTKNLPIFSVLYLPFSPNKLSKMVYSIHPPPYTMLFY